MVNDDTILEIKRRRQLLDEFCKNGKLEPYREVLSRILGKMLDNGVAISARYDVEFSNYEDYSTADDRRIRISLKNVCEPLDVLWILFHEYGHFLSPKRKIGDNKIVREELAWQKAEEEIKDYPELASFCYSFEQCKTRCLNSYYAKEGKL